MRRSQPSAERRGRTAVCEFDETYSFGPRAVVAGRHWRVANRPTGEVQCLGVTFSLYLLPRTALLGHFGRDAVPGLIGRHSVNSAVCSRRFIDQKRAPAPRAN
jgi:hypothetical protein